MTRFTDNPPRGTGFTALTHASGEANEFGLGFGIIRLSDGQTFLDDRNEERAFFHLDGDALVAFADVSKSVKRSDMVAELPTVVHVPAGERVELRSMSGDAEFAVFSVLNPGTFAARVIEPSEVSRTRLGSGEHKDSTERELRTVLDDEGAPHSNMTVGELVNLPGKWSSYPPHTHPHPEIYHYRFFPNHGFGYSQVGDEVQLVRSGDTVLIPPGQTHPQVAAPGFTMVYLWGMPHLPNERFGAGSRRFVAEFSDLQE